MLDARFDSLLEAASPAVLTTYRRAGPALASPVWFRRDGEALEVVIAEGDVKLKHLARRPECSLTVFEAVLPFRGIETKSAPELTAGDVTATRLPIATRYIGPDLAARYAELRDPRGTVLRVSLDGARVWELGGLVLGS